MIRYFPIALSVFLLCSLKSIAQDTLLIDGNDGRKHTFKMDLTAHFFYRKAYVFSYEKLIKSNRSFCITAGYQQFPKLTQFGGSVQSVDETKKNGFKVGGEYRFYLKKENKYSAPRGVYIGPYLSYHYFDNERDIMFTADDGTTEEGVLNSKLSVLNIGFQVGYQFVLNNRWTIDLVFAGPSVSNYFIDMDLAGDFTIDEEEFYQNEMVQRLIETFPLMDDLILEKSVNANGRSSSWSYGYRYQVLIGYHFGRKK